jgi:hypothetical protein
MGIHVHVNNFVLFVVVFVWDVIESIW